MIHFVHHQLKVHGLESLAAAIQLSALSSQLTARATGGSDS